MKYIIVGRSGTGKTTLENMLEQRGMKILYTKTTRPMRGQDDTNYVFLTEKEADAIPQEDKFLYTELNGAQYFTSKKDILDAEVMILEPTGVWEVLNEFPNNAFHVIYMRESDPALRKQFALARASRPGVNQQDAIAAFAQRVMEEDPRFKQFEKTMETSMENQTAIAPNATRLIQISNDYTDATLSRWADWLIAQARMMNNLNIIVQQCIDLDIINVNDRGEIAVEDMEKNVRYVDREYFLDMLANDDAAISILIHGWLAHHVNIGVPDELTVSEENEPAAAEPEAQTAATPDAQTAATPDTFTDKSNQPFSA